MKDYFTLRQGLVLPFIVALASVIPARFSLGLPAGQATPKPFESSLTLDALLTRGNAEKGEIGTKLETEGATPYFEAVRGEIGYAYGESRVDSVDSTTAKRWNMLGNVRRPWERDRTYLFIDAKAESDAVAELNYRVTEGGGAGIYLLKEETIEWATDCGLSWVFEETGDDSDNYPAIRLSERYEREWKTGQKVIQNFELIPRAQRLDDFLLNLDASLETVITALLRLRAMLEYKYQNRPPDDVETYDLRLVLGVSAKF